MRKERALARAKIPIAAELHCRETQRANIASGVTMWVHV